MRKKIYILLLCLISSLFASSKSDDYQLNSSFEVKSISSKQSSSREFVIRGQVGKKKAVALELARRAAVEALLFSGLPAAYNMAETPAIISSSAEDIITKNQEFFNTFFLLKEKKNNGGVYLRYIISSSDEKEVQYDKVKGGYTATITVKVMYDKLREYFEEKGLAEPLDQFEVDVARPTLMVVPADAYMKKRGYGQEVDIDGRMVFDADYEKAFVEDSDLRLVIAKMSKIMAQRGFPLKSLEQTLKTMRQDEALAMVAEGNAIKRETTLDAISRSALPDFILDLDFTIIKQGPQRYIQFVLNGRDPYTNEDPASESGGGKPSSSATASTLLEEAVLNHMDAFCDQLLNYFSDMQKKGRKITVTIAIADNSDDLNFDNEVIFEGEEGSLNDFIEMWMSDHTVNGAYTRTNSAPSQITFEQVRIPLTTTRKMFGKETKRAVTASTFVDDLIKNLKELDIQSVKIERGLGRVDLIIGGTE